MTTYSFTLHLQNLDVEDDSALGSLFEAGCEDATFGDFAGRRHAIFAREAPSLAIAIGSAITAVEAAVPGIQVLRVEADDFVNATEIACRTGRSRESVRLLANGARGPGGFPPPVSWITGRTKFWPWPEVAAWFAESLAQAVPQSEGADFVAALNAALELRVRRPRLGDPAELDAVDALAAPTS